MAGDGASDPSTAGSLGSTGGRPMRACMCGAFSSLAYFGWTNRPLRTIEPTGGQKDR